MQRVLSGLAAAGLLFGCGAGAVSGTGSAHTLTSDTFEPLRAQTATAEPIDDSEVFADAELTELPSAPWSAAPLSQGEVPAPFLAAWTSAENRSVCAPLAPADLGDAEGAEARVSQLIDGGWAVEFDRRGLPGMTSAGEDCASCGRGVVGIAGTTMSPDEMLLDEETEAIEPSFDDGSHLSMEPPADGEHVAAATLALRGQGCVYQVWSHLGEAHLREVVESLRHVNIAAPATVAAR